MNYLGWLVISLVAVVGLSFITRSKNSKEMDRNRHALLAGELNDRQIANAYRKLDTYRESKFYAVIAYGFFYQQYFEKANEDYVLFKAEMQKRELFKQYPY